MLRSGGLIAVRCKSIHDGRYGCGEQIEPDMYRHNGKTLHFFSTAYMKTQLHQFDIIDVSKEDAHHHTIDGGVVVSSFINALAQKP